MNYIPDVSMGPYIPDEDFFGSEPEESNDSDGQAANDDAELGDVVEED